MRCRTSARMSPAIAASLSAIDWPWQTRQRNVLHQRAPGLPAPDRRAADRHVGAGGSCCRRGRSQQQRAARMIAAFRIAAPPPPQRLRGPADAPRVLIVADVLVADHALAIDHEGLGHARRPERQLHRADVVPADPAERVAVPLEETRRRPRAGRGSRCRRSWPRRLELARFGASAMRGTHQLAKTLSSRGCPSARSRLDSPGLPAHQRQRRTPGSAADHRASMILLRAG